MDWVAYAAAAFFFALGGIAVLSLVIQAPGTWILLGLALALEWIDRLYLPPGDSRTFPGWILAACLALAVVGELIEFFAGAAGAKRGGGSRRGVWGALIGGICGVFLFAPLFFFLPLFSTLCGALLGTFVGAVAGELSHQIHLKERQEVLRPALWATAGRVVGTTSKVAIGIAMWLTLSVSAFVR
jgi:uncharacterized protein YqgC (DUF456 family)